MTKRQGKMKDPIYHPLPGRSFPPPRGRARERGGRARVRARSLLFLLLLLFLTLPLSAQRFFNLTNEQVRIDSTLPQFTYTVALPTNYADSVYTPTILYPEFVDMAQSDIEAYHRLSSEPLPPTADVLSARLPQRQIPDPCQLHATCGCKGRRGTGTTDGESQHSTSIVRHRPLRCSLCLSIRPMGEDTCPGLGHLPAQQ